MLIKLLHFKYRDRILRAARTLEEVSFNGNHISIFPNFTVATQKQRAAHTAVKRRLQDKYLPYSMLYLDKLHVVYNV